MPLLTGPIRRLLRQSGAPPTDPLRVRSPSAVALFGLYLRWYVPRHFHAVRLGRKDQPELLPGRPVIVFTNHPSWWDPAMFIVLHRHLMRDRPGYGPMDAASLQQYGILRRMGVFGIESDTMRGAATFLRVGRRVLSDPAGVLWVTAQGRFADPRQRPVTLRPGLAHLARLVPQALLLPLAMEYPFWNESRPEVLMRFGRPVEATRLQGPAGAITSALEAGLTAAMDALALDAAARDPGSFDTLLSGSAGVGGIYDGWRRSRALLSGRRFDPAHEASGRDGTHA